MGSETSAAAEPETEPGSGEAVQGRGPGADGEDPQPSPFPHVGRWTRGYATTEVDEFLATARRAYEGPLEESMSGGDVRRIAFDLVRGGYDPGAVDTALDRLEGAFVRRERAAFVAEHTQEEWTAHVAERATVLYPRLVRPAGERFAPPPHRGQGYRASDVDALLNRVADYFDTGAPLTATDVRAATFASARGHKAYAEGAVDAFLDRVVEVLLAVE